MTTTQRLYAALMTVAEHQYIVAQVLAVLPAVG